MKAEKKEGKIHLEFVCPQGQKPEMRERIFLELVRVAGKNREEKERKNPSNLGKGMV